MSKLDQDLQRLALQEQLLQLDQFDEATAWELGTRIKALCEARQVAVTIEVRRAKETLFFYTMAGVVPNNAEWVRRSAMWWSCCTAVRMRWVCPTRRTTPRCRRRPV